MTLLEKLLRKAELEREERQEARAKCLIIMHTWAPLPYDAPRRSRVRLSSMPADPADGNQKQPNAAVTWARYSEIAFIIPAAVVVGLLLGKLADYLFHTRWLTVAGIVIGAIAGFMQLIRTVMRDQS